MTTPGWEYGRRRAAVRQALSERGVPVRGRTGINVWVPVRDESIAVAALRERNYAVAPGSLYRIGAAPGFRVTVASLEESDVDSLADAVAASIAETPFAMSRRTAR